MAEKPVVCALSGWSGSGKTTLACALVRYLEQHHHLRVAVIKHDGHPFPADVSGSDTCRLADAGALRTVLCGESGLVVRETDSASPQLETLIERFGCDVDVVLLEGFKQADVDKIEVFRPSVGKEPLYAQPERFSRIVAVASDGPLPGTDCPLRLDLNRPEQIAEFILQYAMADFRVSACV